MCIPISTRNIAKTGVSYRLAEDGRAQDAAGVALAAWRGLGCRDAGRVDLRADAAGRPNFMEVNPLAGLHPEHSDLPILCGLSDMSYQILIDSILRSAMKRMPKPGRSTGRMPGRVAFGG